MGLLFVGPMGTGKTFIAKAFVKASGLSAVTLKNFRSKWVGSTEANLEKVLGMVNAVPDFMQHTEVVNGCSDLMVEVFGDAGRHARSAVGVGSLPRGFAVEIEAIVSVKD